MFLIGLPAPLLTERLATGIQTLCRVLGLYGSPLPAVHQVGDRLLTALRPRGADRPTSAFVRDLATSLGMSESWTLDFIVETYRKRFGFDHPDAH
jgi:hypothetical protein